MNGLQKYTVVELDEDGEIVDSWDAKPLTELAELVHLLRGRHARYRIFHGTALIVSSDKDA